MAKLIISFIIVLAITASLLSIYRVVSPSMEDTLLVGDTFIELKFWYGIRLPILGTKITGGHEPVTGDIVLFEHIIDPNRTLVKRCAAVERQTVEIVKKELFVDDAKIPLPPEGKNADPKIIPKADNVSGKRDFISKTVIPDSTIYVLGDNRDYSFDSRAWDSLPVKNLRGKPWIIIWSIDPEVSWFDIKHKIRWKRFFNSIT